MAKRRRDPRSSPAIVQVSIAPTETLVLGDTGRTASRLPRRGVGSPRAAKTRFPRSGRRRSGAANGVCYRRRPFAKRGARRAIIHGTPEQRKRWAKSRPAIQRRRTRYKAPAVTQPWPWIRFSCCGPSRRRTEWGLVSNRSRRFVRADSK